MNTATTKPYSNSATPHLEATAHHVAEAFVAARKRDCGGCNVCFAAAYAMQTGGFLILGKLKGKNHHGTP